MIGTGRLNLFSLSFEYLGLVIGMQSFLKLLI